MQKENNRPKLNSPFSETTVSLVNARIWSRLNMKGTGNGKGTLLSKNSRGIAIAWKHLQPFVIRIHKKNNKKHKHIVIQLFSVYQLTKQDTIIYSNIHANNLKRHDSQKVSHNTYESLIKKQLSGTYKHAQCVMIIGTCDILLYFQN